MILIIGLGNPGEKFNNTPHNLGFTVLDALQEKYSLDSFKLDKKLDSEILEDMLFGKKTILAKPQTFMNESGKAVKKIVNRFKLSTDDLIVVHDDIDLRLGTIKIVKNRGSAGHKGTESIIKALKSENFIRIRLGVALEEKIKEPEKFVLKKFGKKEEPLIPPIIKRAVDAIEILAKDGLEKAMNECNK